MQTDCKLNPPCPKAIAILITHFDFGSVIGIDDLDVTWDEGTPRRKLASPELSN